MTEQEAEKMLGKTVTAQVKYPFGKPRQVTGTLIKYVTGNGCSFGITFPVIVNRTVTVCLDSIKEVEQVEEVK